MSVPTKTLTNHVAQVAISHPVTVWMTHNYPFLYSIIGWIHIDRKQMYYMQITKLPITRYYDNKSTCHTDEVQTGVFTFWLQQFCIQDNVVWHERIGQRLICSWALQCCCLSCRSGSDWQLGNLHIYSTTLTFVFCQYEFNQ